MKILYLSSDTGIPVLGGKGGAVHIREMVAAFDRAGHQVVVVAPSDYKSAGEPQARLAAELVLIPPSPAAHSVRSCLGAYLSALDVPDNLAREVRRILYEVELGDALAARFAADPPDFIYCRAALFASAALALAAASGAPLLVELNAPLAAWWFPRRSSNMPARWAWPPSACTFFRTASTPRASGRRRPMPACGPASASALDRCSALSAA